MMAAKRGLSIGQVLAVTIGFAGASVIVFIFGMWVGKDLAERRLAQEERVVRGVVTPGAPREAPAVDPDITFYDRLEHGATPSGPALAAAAPPTATPDLHLLVMPPTRVAAPTARAVPTSVALAPPRRVPTSVALAGGHPESRVLPTPPSADDQWADAGWTVQVNATTDAQDADHLTRRLKAIGYDAYTVEAPLRGRTWYRVRVGNYRTRDAAQQMEQRLKTAEGFANAYVTAR